ncbi:helix-turn-helix transcriptional regulator [Desulfotomaculum varum]|uniref:Transcriptional repressor CcpN n=1 Tax=Desulforamulus hydrothermalis Lam5 = DSM 18033 TaxID=1121428 RepID=K8E0Q8_9FIRM|nr:helix-turn-helix transcriptional regulator [Desulforamulus hydrothermalis]CCO09110.1 Transcriptional repressor CcpN [Desulforamulus hydrothermalis Lam5 = DSM 18033]SHH12390.1 CBS domain-containing protein [Desulforamulus hydrothermalis Lam5 = DSM 18033]
MELSKRQETIIEIVKKHGPITGEQIAEKLNLTRATLRPDLSILTMAGLLEARPRVGYFYSGKATDRVLADKITRIKVGDVKSVPIVVPEDCSVYDAVVTMFIEDVGTLYVVRQGGLLEGVVSRKDLLKTTLGGHDIHKLPVGVIMTRMPNVHMTFENDSVWLAAHKLLTHEVDSLPVVRAVPGSKHKDYEVIGRFSKTNVTRLFVELGEGA